MDYWVHTDWGEDAAIIHAKDCPHTKRRTVGPDGGLWHGPFENGTEALKFASRSGSKKLTACVVCKP